MSETPETYKPLFKQIAQITRLARARLIWERYAPAMAKGLLAVSLFVTGAYFGLWERIGDPWRLIALIAALAILARSLWKASQLSWPSRSEARRRAELESGQLHRPLDTLDDTPALAADVWPAHYKQAAAQAKRIRAPKGRPTLSKIDPYYLRFAAPAVLLAASVYVAGFGTERLRYSLSPNWQSALNPSDVKFELWIDPPAYTGRPPIYFKDRTAINAPKGSELVMRASGAKSMPRPKLKQGFQSRFLELNQLGTQSFEARTIIDTNTRVQWRIGTRNQSWNINLQPDLAPTIEILTPPKADKRDRLAFTYSMQDDYGVEALRIEMVELFDNLDPLTVFDGVEEFAAIPLSSPSVKKADNASAALDLTRHVLAGRKVIARLVARDGRGQEAVSKSVYFTVPDKIFIEPLAKAVAEQRTLILSAIDQNYAQPTQRRRQDGYWNEYEPYQRLTRAPQSVQRAAVLIEAVTDMPDRLFSDPTVYMGLRHVRAQLRYAESRNELKHIPETLWKIALRAEFGVLGTALEEMREAQAALQEGLARRAPQREIDTLFERYNLAVEAYTEELRRKAIEEGNYAEDGGGGGGEGGGLQSVDEIEELLAAIEEANRIGDVEGARKALAQLAAVLENMQIQLAQGGGAGGQGGAGGGELSEEEEDALEDLAETIGEQRDLQDETRQAERAEQDRENGNETDGNESLSPEELVQRQAELEQLLDQLEEAIPDSLGLGDGAVSAGESEDGSAATDGGETGGGDTGSGEPGEEQSGSGEENGQGNQDGQGNSEGQTGSGSEDGTDGSGGTQTLGQRLEGAREAMRASRNALENGDLAGSREAQSDVISALREAGQALAEAANRGEDDNEGQDAQSGDGDDPLGRDEGNGVSGNNSEADIGPLDNATRSREILEELRRRAAEQGRSQDELEYLERLLKRF